MHQRGVNKGSGEMLAVLLVPFLIPLMWVATPAIYSENVDQQTGFIAIVYASDDKIEYLDASLGPILIMMT